MSEKVVIIADPGLDGAFAVCLALHDPNLDVMGLGACAGNISTEQATKNIHILIEQMDPPRWPKLGAALPVHYEVDGVKLHGTDGLGGLNFPCSQLHNIHPSDRMVADMVKMEPGRVTIVCLGPLTVLSAAMEHEPELPQLVKRLVILGGTLQTPGDAGPVNEFHFSCDPLAARHVLHSGAPITMIPLDAMRELVLSPKDLMNLPNSKACKFLQQIMAFGIGATSNLYGVEGFYLQDVLGIAAVGVPGALTSQPMLVDVEIQGELTRGMSVVDRRSQRGPRPNVEMVIEVNQESIRSYMDRILKQIP